MESTTVTSMRYADPSCSKNRSPRGTCGPRRPGSRATWPSGSRIGRLPVASWTTRSSTLSTRKCLRPGRPPQTRLSLHVAPWRTDWVSSTTLPCFRHPGQICVTRHASPHSPCVAPRGCGGQLQGCGMARRWQNMPRASSGWTRLRTESGACSQDPAPWDLAARIVARATPAYSLVIASTGASLSCASGDEASQRSLSTCTRSASAVTWLWLCPPAAPSRKRMTACDAVGAGYSPASCLVTHARRSFTSSRQGSVAPPHSSTRAAFSAGLPRSSEVRAASHTMP